MPLLSKAAVQTFNVAASASDIFTASASTNFTALASAKAASEGATVTTITIVKIPFPKKTIGIIFGQMTAAWPQRFKTYLLDDDDNEVETKATWDCTKDESRFAISLPANLKSQSELCYGPYDKDYHIAVHCTHKKSGDTSFTESTPKCDTHEFKIGSKHAITFTMVNAEDGGDSDYQDTVVGVAVAYMSTTQ